MHSLGTMKANYLIFVYKRSKEFPFSAHTCMYLTEFDRPLVKQRWLDLDIKIHFMTVWVFPSVCASVSNSLKIYPQVSFWTIFVFGTVEPHCNGSQEIGIFFCYWWTSAIANIRNKRSFMGQKNHFHYRRNYVTSGSGTAGCDYTAIVHRELKLEEWIIAKSH